VLSDHLSFVTALLFKIAAVAVLAGVALGRGLVAAVDGEAIGAVVGIGSFAAITSVAMVRLLKDNRLMTDLEDQRNYEREQKEVLAEKLTASEIELGRYRRTYGAWEENNP